MEQLAIAILAAFGGAGVVLGVSAGNRRRPLPVVLVVLKSGETIRGVQLKLTRSRVILGNAAIMQPNTETPVPADGTVYVDRANVRWIQSTES